MVQFGKKGLVSKDWRRRYQINSESENSKTDKGSSESTDSNSIHCQEWRCDVRPFVMPGNRRTWEIGLEVWCQWRLGRV